MDELTTGSKPNPWMVSTLILAGIVIGYGVSQIPYLKNANQSGTAAIVNPEPGAEQPRVREPEPQVLTEEQIKNLSDDDAVIGDRDAPITLVEFSDYQCPYCSRFFALTLPSIEENYIKTGKVKLVYRDFPLEFHKNALPAAEASECAHEQNKFQEMHDMIFKGQSEWGDSATAKDVFKGYAKTIGLNKVQFASCLDTKKYDLEISKDQIDGAAVGINGTPGFFVNGKLLSGAMPYDLVFKPVFEAELAGKEWSLGYDALGKPVVTVK